MVRAFPYDAIMKSALDIPCLLCYTGNRKHGADASIKPHEKRNARMKSVLYNYDVYPKVFLANRTKQITVQPIGDSYAFSAETEYNVDIYKVDQSNPSTYPERSGRTSLKVRGDADGSLRFSCCFENE